MNTSPSKKSRRSPFLSLSGKRTNTLKVGLHLVLLLTGIAFGADAVSPLSGKLLWKNGETLEGTLRSVVAGNLTWETPLFTEAPSMKLSVLDTVEFNAKTATQPGDDFSVVLRDGSRLYASLDSITDEAVTLHSARHGQMTLRRADVVSLLRVRGGDLIYSGPAGDAGWTTNVQGTQRQSGNVIRQRVMINGGMAVGQSQPAKAQAGISAWQSGPGGTLTTSVWNRRGALALAMPDSVIVDIRLRSSTQLEFNLTLTNKSKKTVTIETWGDELVAVQGTHFERLRKLTPDDRSLALRVCWDSAFGAFSAYTADGTLLKQCSFTDQTVSATDAPGVVLRNKSPDLTLELLRVRIWDGKPQQKTEATGARVEMMDGSVIMGKITGNTTETLYVQRQPGEPGQTVILDKIATIYFQPDIITGPTIPATQIWYADGAMLSGRLLGIKDGKASFQTTFSDPPITSALPDAKKIVLRSPAPEQPDAQPLGKLDSLTISNPGTTLHGTFVGVGEPAPRWKPVGSTTPVAVKGTPDLVFSRAMPEVIPKPKTDALLYLTRGEVIPARVQALDRDVVEMDSPITELHRINAADLRAIQFINSTEINPKGFADSGWRQLRGDEKTLKRTNESIEMSAGASFGHPAMLQGDEVSFSIKGVQGYGAVRLKLLTPGTDSSTDSVSMVLGHFGNRVYVMAEEKGQNRNQQQAPADQKSAPIVRLKLTDKQIELNINGVQLEPLPVKPEQRQGLGIVFESSSLWGNGERPVIIADFALKTGAAQSWVPIISGDPKTQALLVPRFRRDNPPHHVLIAANGDLLRGEIETFAANHFSFLTGLETVRVPRTRVAAAIWLKQPKEDKKPDDKTPVPTLKKPTEPVPLKYASSAPPPTHWLLLTSGAQFGLAVGEFEADAVLGRHALLGACRVPLAEIISIRHVAPPATAAMRAFEDWQLQFAPEPVLPDTGGQDSPLLGNEAKDFTLPLLTGGTFSLKEQKGKVVVLDFWATWCGPCIKSLPELISTMASFDKEKVQFIGVNQAEAPEQVKRFLETRSMSMIVALDADQKVGRLFGVDGIPHTVIIGPDGKVAWVKTGYEPTGAKEAADAVRKLLEAK